MGKSINIVKSTVVPLPIENIDTDQIIPARFLKATSREGFCKIFSRLALLMMMKVNPNQISLEQPGIQRKDFGGREKFWLRI